MFRKRVPQLVLIWGDCAVSVVAAALGITGVSHDINMYLGGDTTDLEYWGLTSSIAVLVIGIVMLMIAL